MPVRIAPLPAALPWAPMGPWQPGAPIVSSGHEAVSDTQSALAGLQAFLSPASWDGLWLAAQGRLGLESGEMHRDIAFNGYARSTESRWTGLAGSVLLGLGRDWRWQTENGQWAAGPLAVLEYSVLQRPGIEEQSGQAARLDVDARLYESLLVSLGGHACLNSLLENGTVLGLDLMAAWRHETLDATFRTRASFRDYGAFDFATATDLPGRDALLVRTGIRLTRPPSVFVQLDLGGEFLRTDYTAVHVGLQLGWDF